MAPKSKGVKISLQELLEKTGGAKGVLEPTYSAGLSEQNRNNEQDWSRGNRRNFQGYEFRKNAFSNTTRNPTKGYSESGSVDIDTSWRQNSKSTGKLSQHGTKTKESSRFVGDEDNTVIRRSTNAVQNTRHNDNSKSDAAVDFSALRSGNPASLLSPKKGFDSHRPFANKKETNDNIGEWRVSNPARLESRPVEKRLKFKFCVQQYLSEDTVVQQKSKESSKVQVQATESTKMVDPDETKEEEVTLKSENEDFVVKSENKECVVKFNEKTNTLTETEKITNSERDFDENIEKPLLNDNTADIEQNEIKNVSVDTSSNHVQNNKSQTIKTTIEDELIPDTVNKAQMVGAQAEEVVNKGVSNIEKEVTNKNDDKGKTDTSSVVSKSIFRPRVLQKVKSTQKTQYKSIDELVREKQAEETAMTQASASNDKTTRILYKQRKQERKQQKHKEEEKRKIEKEQTKRLEQEAIEQIKSEVYNVRALEEAILSKVKTNIKDDPTEVLEDFKQYFDHDPFKTLILSIIVAKCLVVDCYGALHERIGDHQFTDQEQMEFIRNNVVMNYKPLIMLIFNSSEIPKHQLQFLKETQMFLRAMKFPRISDGLTLIEAIWDALYITDCIEEQYYLEWYEALDDDTLGRETVVFQMLIWFDWLKSALIEGQTLTNGGTLRNSIESDEEEDDE